MAQTHETLAHAWAGAKKHAEAAASFRQAIAARQLSGDLRWLASDRNFYGLQLRTLHDVEGARREFEAARDLAAEDGFVAGQAGALEQSGDPRGGCRQLRRSPLALPPGGSASWFL